MTDSAATTQAFKAMAAILYAGSSYDDVYATICSTALELVDACDHASMMLRRGNKTWTAAATDQVGRRIDELERELGEGPCLDAITEEAAHACADLTSGSEWPDLARRVLAETPVRGMAGFRIVLEGHKEGALNIFSDTPGALSGASLDQAAMLTAFASVALTAVERGEEASTLRLGLQSNREIGKALGLLMAIHKISDEEAFEMLSKVSQDMNLKLATVASRVVAAHNTPPATD
jgi:hypothetical protein